MLQRAACLTLLPCLPLLAQEATPKVLTLEQASGRADAPSFGRRAPRAVFSADGKHVIVGRDEEERWIDVETLVESAPPADPPEAEPEDDEAGGPSQAEVAEALATLDGLDEKSAARLARRPREKAADGSTQLFMRDGHLFFFQEVKGRSFVGQVPVTEGPFELLDLSDEGGIAGWVKDNDLYLLNTRSGDIVRVTENGSEERFNGKLDWVYQEELYGRGDFKAFWLAPTGGHVAFLSLDESPVHSYTVVDHVEDDTFRVKGEVSNYPKAGDPNPIPTLGLASTKDGKTRWVDLSKYDGQEILIVRVGWYTDGRCLFMVQDRIQTWCDVNLVDPKTGKVETLIREESETWTERPQMPRWLEDGTFLWMSARTGMEQVYRYGQDGKLLGEGPLTSGGKPADWSVRRITEVDEEAGQLYFNASEGGATDTNLYRVGLDGEGWTRLTRGRGAHRVTFNAGRTHLLDRVSALDMPEEVRLCDGNGDLIKRLAVAGPSSAEEQGYPVANWEVHEVAARDGFPLDVALLKPVPFDEGSTHPVWIMTYSGPDAPSVRNRWNSSAWPQFLAENGIICLQVNVRSASGKGQAVIGSCYKQLGVPELADLEDTVDWLCASAWADAARVGITGYSYGGFMSAYALLASDKFVLGLAGGGVYDWGMYDTIYTERYMSTPQLNPEGYEKTSCLKRAGDLNGFLHMHHGVMDDNVHFQNMMQMAYALQRAGQTSWSMMAYPQTRHGIRDGEQRWHARQLEWDLIREHLRPATVEVQVGEAFDAAVGEAVKDS